MRTEIKLPKEIDTLSKFMDWCLSKETRFDDLEIRMKRRTNFQPYDFRDFKRVDGKIEYLISDGVSYGLAKISSFNKIFSAFIVESPARRKDFSPYSSFATIEASFVSQVETS